MILCTVKIVCSENMDEYIDYLAEIVRLGNPSFKNIFLTIGTIAPICGFLFNRIVVFTLAKPKTIDWNVITVNSKI